MAPSGSRLRCQIEDFVFVDEMVFDRQAATDVTIAPALESTTSTSRNARHDTTPYLRPSDYCRCSCLSFSSPLEIVLTTISGSWRKELVLASNATPSHHLLITRIPSSSRESLHHRILAIAAACRGYPWSVAGLSVKGKS